MLIKIKKIFNEFFGMSITLIRIVRNANVLKKNKLPKNGNSEIYILGNGPSLTEFLSNDFTSYMNVDFFAVNKFCLSEAYQKIKPKYYVFADPSFFKDTKDESILLMQKNVMKKLVDETDWEMNLFIPIQKDKQSIEAKLTNSNLKIFYYSPLTVEGPDSVKHMLFDRGIGMPFVGNVLIASLILSIRMGYKKINIVGAEQSIHVQAYVNKTNQVCVEYDYFDGSKIEAVFWDDLDPTKPQKYHEFLRHWTDTFKSYHEVESFAKYKNCKIANMTNNSYIDAFERDVL